LNYADLLGGGLNTMHLTIGTCVLLITCSHCLQLGAIDHDKSTVWLWTISWFRCTEI